MTSVEARPRRAVTSIPPAGVGVQCNRTEPGRGGVGRRITYTGDNPDGGTNTFTITVFKGGKDVASLLGSASEVPPGRTITADLISTDKFVAGPYTYDFQKGS
ncbi:hypothetical protein [Streptomyces vilmorinianum]|uniref:hypothetical protein n=1 Tax=Streptomyces vilmorinianum TaxID=3051092 RepID=UPI0010FB5F55|nr:hypothetical protein [Streptomyces vilmorinianum]